MKRTNMKKWDTVLFAVILLMLLTGISSFLNPAVQGSRLEVSERNKNLVGVQREPRNTLDALVIGDSLSYASVSPMEIWEKTGIAVYDCGQSGQRIPETYYTLKTALKTQKPKVIFLETNLLFRYGGVIKETAYALGETGSYYFPVFRYHNLWKTLTGAKQGDTKTDYKGFAFRVNVESYRGESYHDREGYSKEISAYIKFYVERILNLCRQNGAQLVLYSAPSPRNYCKKKIQKLKNYAEELQVPYLELNEKRKEMNINWKTDTLDKGDHLNIYGAKKVSWYLADYLKKNYELQDHRGKRGYLEWDKMALQYEREFLNIKSKRFNKSFA